MTWYEHQSGRPGASNIRWQERTVTSFDGAGLAAADFNGEGRTHLLAGAVGTGELRLSGNDGTPGVGPWADIPLVAPRASAGVLSPLAADMDSDGLLDAVVATMGAGSIDWHENQGSSGVFPFFGPAEPIAAGAADPRGVFAMDIDMDGDVDIVAALQSSGTIGWYESDFAPYPASTAKPVFGTPAHVIWTAVNTFPVGVSAADLDGDGDPDVISATFSDNKIAWYEQTNAADPHDADTDGDGLCDGGLAGGGTAAACPIDGEDTNGNGQYDVGVETDPNNPDTDFDTFNDGLEVVGGSDPLDAGSTPPACSDGIDNDGDGLTDFPTDIGCANATSDNEAPECQDGINNDALIGTDFDGGESILGVGNGDPDGADPHCTSFWDNKEKAPSSGGTCGIGPELVLLLPPLGAWRARRRERA